MKFINAWEKRKEVKMHAYIYIYIHKTLRPY